MFQLVGLVMIVLGGLALWAGFRRKIPYWSVGTLSGVGIFGGFCVLIWGGQIFQ